MLTPAFTGMSKQGSTSSGAFGMVPMLDGTNWIAWSSKVQSLFMAEGLWDVVNGTTEKPSEKKPESSDEKVETLTEWVRRDYKAQGILRLKVVDNLHHVFIHKETSNEAWKALKAELGKPGTAQVFVDFLAITRFKLSGANPEPEFAKLATHIAALATNGVTLPDFVPAMMVLANVPVKWDHIAARISSSYKIDELSVAEIRMDFVNEYQRTATSKTFSGQKEKSANKISAVKPYRGNPKWQGTPYQRDQPNRQQDQGWSNGANQGQPRPDSQSGGKRQKKQKKRANAAFMPFNAESSPHAYQGEPRLAPTFENPAVEAISLAHRLGVQPTVQSVKQLMGGEKTEDPRVRPMRLATPEVTMIQEDDEWESLFDEKYVSTAKIGQINTDAYIIPTQLGGEVPILRDGRSGYVNSTVDTRAMCAGTLNCNLSECDSLWILDSGASKHFTPYQDDLDEYVEFGVPEPLGTATKGAQLSIVGKGKILLQQRGSGDAYHVAPVYYVPGMDRRLLSIGQFRKAGLEIMPSPFNRLDLGRDSSTYFSFEMSPINDLYVMDADVITVESYKYSKANTLAVDQSILHQRLGHPSLDVLKHVRRHAVGVPECTILRDEHPCEACAEGKMPASPFPASTSRAEFIFDLVHSDLMELPIKTRGGLKYVLTFFDDHTSHAWISLIRRKSDAAKHVKEFVAMVQTQFGKVMKEWQIDGGGEFASADLLNHLKAKGIVVRKSLPYMHQQNGRAERFNRTLTDKMQTMRLAAGLQNMYWDHAALYALWLYNRVPIKRIAWKSPHEMVYKLLPDMASVRVFGCAAYVRIPPELRVNKLARKAEEMTFIGFSDGMKGYKFLRKNGSVFMGETAVFDERRFPMLKPLPAIPSSPLSGRNPEPSGSNVPMDVDDVIIPTTGGSGTAQPNSSSGRDTEIPETDEQNKSGGEAESVHNDTPAPPLFTIGSNNPASRRQAEIPRLKHYGPTRRSSRPLKPRRVPNNIYDEAPDWYTEEMRNQASDRWRDLSQRNVERTDAQPEAGPSNNPMTDAELGAQAPEPNSSGDADVIADTLASLLAWAFPAETLRTSFGDIRGMPSNERGQWYAACQEELDTLKAQGVYEIVDLPPGRKSIKNRWVFA